MKEKKKKRYQMFIGGCGGDGEKQAQQKKYAMLTCSHERKSASLGLKSTRRNATRPGDLT
jgi:hypothetical protein